MNNYNCEIAADSLNTFGNRITTFKLTYPRIIHSELMTHRVFSRNAASSRAVPVKKMIEFVRNNMFTPLAVQKSHKGMQGSDYFEGVELEQAKQLWIESAELALQQAEKMEKFGITKQLINRILEPYQYYQVLVTATEWENFFKLRCPKYELSYYPLDRPEALEPTKISFRSKKDYNNFILKLNWTSFQDEQEWYRINTSQAEIHIQTLAETMWDAMNESTPKELKAGEYHIPFGDRMDEDKVAELYYEVINNDRPNSHISSIEETKIKISTARCARLSYMTFDGEIDYEKDLKLHNTLLESQHMSPFEHCARAMSDEEYFNFVKGERYSDGDFEDAPTRMELGGTGWCYNLKGFISYRYLIDNKVNL